MCLLSPSPSTVKRSTLCPFVSLLHVTGPSTGTDGGQRREMDFFSSTISAKQTQITTNRRLISGRLHLKCLKEHKSALIADSESAVERAQSSFWPRQSRLEPDFQAEGAEEVSFQPRSSCVPAALELVVHISSKSVEKVSKPRPAERSRCAEVKRSHLR